MIKIMTWEIHKIMSDRRLLMLSAFICSIRLQAKCGDDVIGLFCEHIFHHKLFTNGTQAHWAATMSHLQLHHCAPLTLFDILRAGTFSCGNENE